MPASSKCSNLRGNSLSGWLLRRDLRDMVRLGVLDVDSPILFRLRVIFFLKSRLTLRRHTLQHPLCLRRQELVGVDVRHFWLLGESHGLRNDTRGVFETLLVDGADT